MEAPPTPAAAGTHPENWQRESLEHPGTQNGTVCPEPGCVTATLGQTARATALQEPADHVMSPGLCNLVYILFFKKKKKTKNAKYKLYESILQPLRALELCYQAS